MTKRERATLRRILRQLIALIDDMGREIEAMPDYEGMMLMLGDTAADAGLIDEAYQLAARCKGGRAVLKRMAQ